MKVEIITPQNQKIIEDVVSIQLPGLDGLFAILNNHAPLITALSKGKAKVINKNNETSYHPIEGGIVEVLKNKIIILTEKL
ncbi:MAG: F0F1 ATP synthase subunit epsilon [Bacteroidales bacterium]|nr:F0F1 ATP synthase subunit epsilon [Bacteroidales bacterium]